MISDSPYPDRWSLESWFSAFAAPDYAEFKASLVHDVEAMKVRASALGSDVAEIVSVINVGAPFIQGATVAAKVLGQIKGEKVVAFKFRRRKGYHRTVGHRQRLTRVEITSINA